MKPTIQAIGTAVPPYKISQEAHYSILESANGMSREQKIRLRKIYAHSGIQYRHSVLQEFGGNDNEGNILFHPAGKEAPLSTSLRMELYERHAANLAAEAVTKCFNQLSLSPSSVTHLITFSCTGMYAPGLDVELVEKLGLQRNVERTCINFMGCYAGINALKTAYHIARSEPEAVVLLAGAELCSLHYNKSEEQNQVVANALFADGAAAAIVSSKKLKQGAPGLSILDFYAEFDPTGQQEMVWRIGDHGFDLQLSPEVPALIKRSIKELIDKLFIKAGIRQGDIDYYAIHPGGMKILEACESALQITKEQNGISYGVLRDYGNMSSVTVFFVLNEYFKNLASQQAGKKLLTCAFGPGLTMESAILEIIS